MFKECLIVPLLLGSSISQKSRVVETSQPVYQNVEHGYYEGTYNFRDYFDFDSFFSFCVDNNIGDIDEMYQIDHLPPESGVGMPLDTMTYPCSYFDETYYVYQIHLYSTDYDEIGVSFFAYASLNDSYIFSTYVENNTDLSDLSSWTHNFIFQLRRGVTFSNYSNLIFDYFFTTENNDYTTSYYGYFTFFGNQYYYQPFTAFGTEAGNSMLMINMYTGAWYSGPYDSIMYDERYAPGTSTEGFDYQQVSLPLNMQNYDKQILVNWKLSKSSYTALESVGAFGYLRDPTYDDASFQDLLFTVMDSPIYMLSRLLSFELFGTKLFIALTGLLAVAIIVVLIKRFV